MKGEKLVYCTHQLKSIATDPAFPRRIHLLFSLAYQEIEYLKRSYVCIYIGQDALRNLDLYVIVSIHVPRSHTNYFFPQKSNKHNSKIHFSLLCPVEGKKLFI